MLELSIITAEKTIFQGTVVSVTVPTVTGEIGILTGHQSLIGKLDIGGIKLVNADKSEQIIFVAGGFVQVDENKVAILADTAENLEAIGLEQAIEARKQAEAKLSETSDEINAERLKSELRMMMIRERLAQIAQYKK